MTQSSHRMQHTKTRAQRKAASTSGDPVLGHAEKKRRKWVIRTLIMKHGGLCALCGGAVVGDRDVPDGATIDHIVPVSKGGLDVATNWQLAHRRCNGTKGAS